MIAKQQMDERRALQLETDNVKLPQIDRASAFVRLAMKRAHKAVFELIVSCNGA